VLLGVLRDLFSTPRKPLDKYSEVRYSSPTVGFDRGPSSGGATMEVECPKCGSTDLDIHPTKDALQCQECGATVKYPKSWGK
jgi:ribosomal protein S27E